MFIIIRVRDGRGSSALIPWRGEYPIYDPHAAEDLDLRSLDVTEADLTSAILVSMLESRGYGAREMGGERWLKYLKKEKNLIRLGAEAFLILWKNRKKIPESWKGDGKQACEIYFHGTIFGSDSRRRYVLYIRWKKNRWHWGIKDQSRGIRQNSFSAVLVVPPEPDEDPAVPA